MANYKRFTVQATINGTLVYLTKHAGANGKLLREHVTRNRADAGEYLVDETVGINELETAEAKRSLAESVAPGGWAVVAD